MPELLVVLVIVGVVVKPDAVIVSISSVLVFVEIVLPPLLVITYPAPTASRILFV